MVQLLSDFEQNTLVNDKPHGGLWRVEPYDTFPAADGAITVFMVTETSRIVSFNEHEEID